MTLRSCLLLGWLLATAGAARGQGALAGSRRDVAAQSAPAALSLSATPAAREAAVSTPGTILGLGSEFGEQEIVQRRAHPEPWSAGVDTQFYGTSNAGLTSSHEKGDWYLRSGAAISYTNLVKGPVFVDFNLQQYFFRYGKYNALDFDLTRFQGGALVRASWLDDAFFFGRYRLERITESGFGSTYLTSHVAELGVQKVWKISRGQQISGALEADLPIDTDPRQSGRREYSASLAYTLRLTARLTASLSYRGAWYDYTDLPRSEWNHIFSLDANYDLTDWLHFGVSTSYTCNDANHSVYDYGNLVYGGSAALRISF